MPRSQVGKQSDDRPRGQAIGLSKRQRIRRRSVYAAGALAVACLSAGAVLGYQAWSVKANLERAVGSVPELRSDLAAGNNDAARSSFISVSDEISAAHSKVSGPLWTVAMYVPVIGPNFSAVKDVVISAEDVASLAIEPLLDTYSSIDWRTLAPTEGQLDVAQLQEAAPTISVASNALELSHRRLLALDLEVLLPAVATPVQEFTQQLGDVAGIMNAASSAATLLPPMLGSESPRTYLILVQNNAEARATGGIPGALSIIHADKGRLVLGEQTSAGALGVFRPPVEVDPAQVNLFTARLGTQMQNVNLTPDFPTAAQAAKQMWEERNGQTSIDGVISLDPVVLARLLGATGAVDLTEPEVLALIADTRLPIELTDKNVVTTLLSDVYREIEDPELQDAYFAAVASRIFDAFTNGQGDTPRILEALVDSANERRLQVWSSEEKEQTVIASTPLAGSVAGARSGGAIFGAYFNDGTGAKMDYYAERSVQLRKTCPSDGYGRYTVRVSVHNNAPADAASSLPPYVTGGGVYGINPGDIRTNYVFYGPAQSVIERVNVNGEQAAFSSGNHAQRPVGSVTVQLAPGESAAVEVLFSKVVQGDDERVEVTPTVAQLKDTLLPMETESCE